MKKEISHDEWYPVYTVEKENEAYEYLNADFTQEELDFIKLASENFIKAQEIIHNKYCAKNRFYPHKMFIE